MHINIIHNNDERKYLLPYNQLKPSFFLEKNEAKKSVQS